MTYGEKLIQLRKNADMTQADLGVRLGVTPQAVSKWEHDVAEPDLSTLRKISEIFKISIDDFLDNSKDITTAQDAIAVAEEITPIVVDNAMKEVKESVVGEIVPAVADSVVKEMTPVVADSVATGMKEHTEAVKEAVEVAQAKTLGFCVECGIVVTDDNKGLLKPKILCAECYKTIREKANAEKRAKEEKDVNERLEFRHKRNVTLFLGSALAAFVVAITLAIVILAKGDVGGKLIVTVLGLWVAYGLFSLVFECRMDDGIIIDIMEWGLTRSIRWPGVIFTLDFGGLIFLIGIKILFAVLGFIIGAILFVFALGISMLISPFLFPFGIRKVNKKIRGELPIEMIDKI